MSYCGRDTTGRDAEEKAKVGLLVSYSQDKAPTAGQRVELALQSDNHSVFSSPLPSPLHPLLPRMRRWTTCRWTRRRRKPCRTPCRSGPMCASHQSPPRAASSNEQATLAPKQANVHPGGFPKLGPSPAMQPQSVATASVVWSLIFQTQP